MPNADSPPGKGSWNEIQRPFFMALTMSFILLQLLFLGDVSYVYATLFREGQRIQKFNLLYVDYDGGVVGASVMDAYRALQGPGFPTLQPASVEEYPTGTDVRRAVCKGGYWGAVYVDPGASANLAAALDSGTSTPSSISYVWNGARYPAFTQSGIYSNILALIQTTRGTYYARNASYVLQSANLSNPAVAQVFLDPIQATEINIKVTNQGSRVFYGTISTVMPILQQFFFMMALNGISAQFQIFARLSWMRNVCLRAALSISYTLVGALCMTGYIWGFKEGWDVNGNQFVLSWMIIWLYMQISFLVFDILTTFVPMPFMPFCVLTWVLINIASTLSPFEVNPGFFRWGYALPSHETYQVLVQIWTGGCNDQLYRALPIMFSWWVVGLIGAVLCMRYRCREALRAQEADHQAEAKPEEKDNETQTTLVPETPDTQSGTLTSSVDDGVSRARRQEIEAMRLENLAYHPSYPGLNLGWRGERESE